MTDTYSPSASNLAPERLNQTCFCITLDRDKLGLALDGETGEPGFLKNLTE